MLYLDDIICGAVLLVLQVLHQDPQGVRRRLSGEQTNLVDRTELPTGSSLQVAHR